MSLNRNKYIYFLLSGILICLMVISCVYNNPIVSMLICSVDIALLFLYLNYKNNNRKWITEVILSSKFSFIFEALLYLFTELYILYYIDLWVYTPRFAVIQYVVSSILLGYLFFYITLGIKKFKSEYHKVFLFVAIPIAFSYPFLILPDRVPDEVTHFAKAWLTSDGNLTSELTVNLPSDFTLGQAYNYLKLRDYIFLRYCPTFANQDLACSYSFILYIIPAIAIRLARIFRFSTISCYMIGRLANTITFLVFGYNSIRISPYYKRLLFIFLLNPILLQQSTSLSSDSLLYSILVFAVAYFFFLYEKECIDNKDIIIVISMIFFTIIAKYLYLVCFGIYLLLIPKLLKINRKQILLLIISILVGLVCTAICHNLKLNAGSLPSTIEYVSEHNIVPSEQIMYMIANPIETIITILRTILCCGIFYVESSIGYLSSFAFMINRFAIYYYLFIVLFISTFDKKSWLNSREKVYFFFLGGIIILLCFLAMYIYWSPVGYRYAEGVQGRYFLPGLLLIFMSFNGLIKKKFTSIDLYLLVSILFVQFIAIHDIFIYYVG